MSIEDSGPAPGRMFFGMFQHDRTNFLDSIRLGAFDIVRDVIDAFWRGYNGAQNAASSQITRPGATQDEPGALEIQPVNIQQDTTTGQQPIEPPGPPSPNHNSFFASQAGDSEEAGQLASGEEHSSDETAPIRSKRTTMWMALLVVGVLSLIVVPGLVLGFVTGQVEAGIALSGSIGTIVGVFAGIYYYPNK